MTRLVDDFYNLLEPLINIPIILFDESYSTKLAKAFLRENNYSSYKIKKHKDMLAAEIILQFYLDRKNKKKKVI